MGRVWRWFAAALLSTATLAVHPLPAFARSSAKVEWTRIEVPKGEGSERLERTLRKLLKDATRKADFGDVGRVALRVRLAEFSSVHKGDVLRVSCTLFGRVEGGSRARSRISFGGDPKDREALEKQVLTMVANGVVARLAEIVRARAAKEKAERARKDEHEKEPDMDEDE